MKTFAEVVATIAVLAAISAVPNRAFAADLSKLSPDLAAAVQPSRASASVVKRSAHVTAPAAAPNKIRVIIRLAQPQIKERVALLKRGGLRPVFGGKSFAHLGIEVALATPAQIRAFAANPAIASVSLDRPVKLSQATDAQAAVSSLLDANGPSVGANVAGSQVAGTPGLDGTGVTVAVIDSGVAPVDDIKNHIVAFHDFVNGQTLPYDDNGHGTHVAGIVAGDGTDSSGAAAIHTYKGIAPGAGIVGVKVTDANGNTNASTVIAGIEWCIANKATYNIRVINLSLGGAVLESYKTDPICQAVEQAVTAGIVVVTSAGNYGGTYGYITSPGNDPAVITVGASNSEQSTNRSIHRITSYTSRGPTIVDAVVKPDLIAPGNKVVSLRVPGSTIDVSDTFGGVDSAEYLSGDTAETPSAYTRLSGTSMAAPAVAGAVAIMLQQNASLHPNGVKLALMYSAQPLKGYDPVLKATVTYDPFTEGAGELNIPGATQIASLMSPTGLSSTASMTSTIGGGQFSWFAATAADHLAITGDPTKTFWGNPNVWSIPALWSDESLTWGGDETIVATPTPVQLSAESLTWGGDETLAWASVQSLTWGGDETLAASILSAESLTWGGDETLTWGAPGSVTAQSLTWGGDETLTSGDPNSQSLTWGGDETLTCGNLSSQSLTWGGDETIADAQAVMTGDQ